MPGIHSQRVILIEGDADEIVPNAKLAADMHGFVIMVPPGEGGERLLDMLWRITMAYAGMPSMLRSRTTVRKMVEAVWSKEAGSPGQLAVSRDRADWPILLPQHDHCLLREAEVKEKRNGRTEMRALIISDIHANLPALEAVLAAAPRHDAVWNLGDVVAMARIQIVP